MKPSLHDVVEPVLAKLGLELEDIATVRAGSRVVVRITVDGDGPDGHGPNLDDVAEASTAISNILDESNTMGDQPYVLEVGTRGVSRPLTAPQHWRRNLGHLVKVTRAGTEPVIGRIVAATETGAEVDGLGFVPFTDVVKAVVQAEMRDVPDEEQ